ncbi:Gfo/Idh/MocA family oxidoreductase [Candidatus Pelagibacter sp.]|nr:Gfo/Idh/MocA family oxidoreductase [Candidatus Pelagibacter sp.]
MRRINIGLIGAGVLGLKRIQNLPKNFKFIGCADPLISLKKLNFRNKNILLTKNWKELISLKNLESIIIATTHHLHSEILEECIKKDIHIFIEKPAGISSVKTKLIISRLKKKKNLILRVGFNHRYHPAFLKAKKMIKKKKIGKILYIRAVYGHGGRLNYEKEWRFNKKFSGGGELIDKGSHLIDLSRLFLGDLKVNHFNLKTYFWNIKLEDNCYLNLENKKGNLAFLHASCTEWKNKFIFEIFGKFGKIEINGLGRSYGQQSLTYYKMSKKMGIPKKKTIIFPDDPNYSWNLELKEFYNDIIKKRKSVPGILEAYENLKIINLIYKKNDNN